MEQLLSVPNIDVLRAALSYYASSGDASASEILRALAMESRLEEMSEDSDDGSLWVVTRE